MAVKRIASAVVVWFVVAPAAFAEAPGARAVESEHATPREWPAVLTRNSGSAPAAVWTPQEIQTAQARCAVLLKGLDVVAVPESAMREGRQCGSAAPMKLISIGRGTQEVTFSPAPIVTCDMIAALAKWVQQDVQPLAVKHLGSVVSRIETMSSYSCRNAYGRIDSRLSEHAKANAVDLGTFVTARNQTVNVEGDWGPTNRDIQLARTRTEDTTPRSGSEIQPADRRPAEAATVRAATPVQTTTSHGVTVIRPGQQITGSLPAAQASAADLPRLPGISLQFGFGQAQPAMGFAEPSRLGGPKPRNAATAYIPKEQPAAKQAQPASLSAKAEFLRGAHKAACRLFGTVLGPEHNRTHRNHFHVDMAERVQNTKVCE